MHCSDERSIRNAGRRPFRGTRKNGLPTMQPLIFAGSLAFVLTLDCQAQPKPCSGVDRRLSDERKIILSSAIAKQLHEPVDSVLASFATGGWRIVFVKVPASDAPFLFFRADPRTSRYVTIWSGAARVTEEQEIASWAMKHAPRIPKALARCFAWYVTRGPYVTGGPR